MAFGSGSGVLFALVLLSADATASRHDSHYELTIRSAAADLDATS